MNEKIIIFTICIDNDREVLYYISNRKYVVSNNIYSRIGVLIMKYPEAKKYILKYIKQAGYKKESWYFRKKNVNVNE
jgi:hypothetical protein